MQQLTSLTMFRKGSVTVPSADMRHTMPRCSTTYRSPVPSPALVRNVSAWKPSANGSMPRWNGSTAVGDGTALGEGVGLGRLGGEVQQLVGGAWEASVVGAWVGRPAMTASM